MSHTPTAALSAKGVSIWLDDLSRQRIVSGELKRLIDERDVVGVTTNPTIFAKALSQAHDYDEKVRALAADGADTERAVFELTTADVRDAADIMREVYDRTDGLDGRVSIEVGPALANDTHATIEEAKRLWATVDRPNIMVKIPATKEGLGAITAATAVGISVNVTLIFGLERHREVINAYLTGLEQAREAGIDLSTIRSVASFFVSRVDSEIDSRLDAVGTDEARALKGKAAVANARLAYEVFEQGFSSERARTLLDAGAHTQRPLWASTGVKNPDYPDTLYVTELVVDDVVNTMPEKTLEAVADHGEITGDTVHGTYEDARAVLDAVAAQGISYAEVVEQLEREGVEKFVASWDELSETVTTALAGTR